VEEEQRKELAGQILLLMDEMMHGPLPFDPERLRDEVRKWQRLQAAIAQLLREPEPVLADLDAHTLHRMAGFCSEAHTLFSRLLVLYGCVPLDRGAL